MGDREMAMEEGKHLDGGSDFRFASENDIDPGAKRNYGNDGEL